MELPTIKMPDTADIEPRVNDFITAAETLDIKTDNDFAVATDLLKKAKGLSKFITDLFDPTKKALNSAKNELMKVIKIHTEPLDKAERMVKVKIADYHTHKEEERRRQEEELRKQREKEEAERRLDEAVETGDESILDEPIITPAIKIEDTTKTDGISYTYIYKYEIVNEKQIPFPNYWMVDEKKIGQMVRAAKGEIEIPGVRIYKEKIVRASA